MALADPTLTIGGVATPLVRTGMSLTGGRFASADSEVTLAVDHAQAKRNRHLYKVSARDIVADPLVPAQSIPVDYSVHLVIDLPRQGVDNATAVALAKATVASLTDAVLAKVVAGES